MAEVPGLPCVTPRVDVSILKNGMWYLAKTFFERAKCLRVASKGGPKGQCRRHKISHRSKICRLCWDVRLTGCEPCAPQLFLKMSGLGSKVRYLQNVLGYGQTVSGQSVSPLATLITD